eukprot:gene8913-16538_t
MEEVVSNAALQGDGQPENVVVNLRRIFVDESRDLNCPKDCEMSTEQATVDLSDKTKTENGVNLPKTQHGGLVKCDNTETVSAERNQMLRDEPISESEFQLLFVNLDNLENKNPYVNQHNLETTFGPGNGFPKTQINSDVPESNNPSLKRGRGRPKGSTNKSTAKKLKKKESKTKQKRFVYQQTEILPDRLKKKVKVESDVVINLTKRIIAPVMEKTFELKENVDKSTWKLLDKKSIVCALCNKPGNFAVLGPLFGPYRLSVNSDPGRQKQPHKDEKTLFIRLHRDCSIWTPGICIIESELRGIAGAISEAARKKCNICSEIGASLVCLNGACTRSFHYVCAKQTVFLRFVSELFAIDSGKFLFKCALFGLVGIVIIVLNKLKEELVFVLVFHGLVITLSIICLILVAPKVVRWEPVSSYQTSGKCHQLKGSCNCTVPLPTTVYKCVDLAGIYDLALIIAVIVGLCLAIGVLAAYFDFLIISKYVPKDNHMQNSNQTKKGVYDQEHLVDLSEDIGHIHSVLHVSAFLVKEV